MNVSKWNHPSHGFSLAEVGVAVIPTYLSKIPHRIAATWRIGKGVETTCRDLVDLPGVSLLLGQHMDAILIQQLACGCGRHKNMNKIAQKFAVQFPCVL